MSGIGDLVARLSMDNRDFVKGANQAKGITSGLASSITSALGPVSAAFAGAFAFVAMITGAKEAQAAEAKLNAVLTASGHAAGVTTEEVKGYAAALQKVTNFEDDATVGAAAMLASFGNIRGDNFERAIALAQDMATVMNVDLDTAVKKMGKSFKDLSPEEVTKKLDEMQKKFGGAAMAAADPLKQLQNHIGDVGEAIGAVLVPVLNRLAIVASRTLIPMGEMFARNADLIERVVVSSIGVFGVLQMFAPESANAESGVRSFAAAFDDLDDAEAKLEKVSDIMKEVARLRIQTATGGDQNAAARATFEAGGANEFELRQFDEAIAAHDKMIAKKDELKRSQDELNKSTQEAIAKGFEWNRLVEEMDDEIAVLTGTMTKQEAAAKGFMRQGFDEAGANELAAKQAEIDGLKADGKTPNSASSAKSDNKAVFAGSSEVASIMLRGIGGGNEMKTIATKQLAATERVVVAVKEIEIPALIAGDFGV